MIKPAPRQSSVIISLLLIFTICQPIKAQYVIQDFTYPACANGGLADTISFYEAYNGDYNGGNYKVIFATLFTAW